MRKSRHRSWVVAAVYLLFAPAHASGQIPDVATASDVNVLTQHNDQARRGAYLAETALTPTNVNRHTFGRLYSRPVKGFVSAQPLYVSNVRLVVNGSERVTNLVIVATAKNYVYAFDDGADKTRNGELVWSRQLPYQATLPKQFVKPHPCSTTTWAVGITSTPVIDSAAMKLYLVARDGKDGGQWLHALDVRNGTDVGATRIEYPGGEPGGPKARFDPSLHINRAALLLTHGQIFVAFAAMCDRGDAHGWVFEYDAALLKRTGVLNVTPNSQRCENGLCYSEGGIWQSGNGPVVDARGKIYVITGNGDFTPARQDFGCAFLQLDPAAGGQNLEVARYFAPDNCEELNKGDVDLGSGGPVLLPGDKMIGGGKQGRYYVVDVTPSTDPKLPLWKTAGVHDPADHFEGFQAFVNTHHPGSFTGKSCSLYRPATEDDIAGNIKVFARAMIGNGDIPYECYGYHQYYGPNIHGGPVYWEPDCSTIGLPQGCSHFGLIYGTAEKDYLKAFYYDVQRGEVNEKPRRQSTLRAPEGMPGAFLSLSANGNRDGILWVSMPKTNNTFLTVKGRLVALDAATLGELWRDDSSVRFPKFSPPTVANGHVFRAAFGEAKGPLPCVDNDARCDGELVVYGLGGRNPRRCWLLRIFGIGD